MQRQVIALILVIVCTVSPSLAQGPSEAGNVGPAVEDNAVITADAPELTMQTAEAVGLALRPAVVAGLTVARDDSGGLWAAWEVDDGHDAEIVISRQVAGQWTTPAPAHTRPEAWDRFPSLATGPDGRPWLAWASALRTDPDRRLLLISHWTGDRWTEPELVPLGSTHSAAEPVLVTASDGTLWLAWAGTEGISEEIYASHLLSSALHPDGSAGSGAWSAPWRVSAEDDPALGRSQYDRHPRLAIGSDNRPWLTWTGHQSGIDDEIYASHWTGNGWTPEQVVNTDDSLLDTRSSLAIDGAGVPWIAWQGRDGTGPDSYSRISVCHWQPASNAWSAETAVSLPAGTAVEETAPILARDKQGRLRLAWLARRSSRMAQQSSDPASVAAQATWSGTAWTAPEIVSGDVSAEALAWQPAGDDKDLALLWLALDPEPPAGSPLGEAADQGIGSLADWAAQSEPEPEARAGILGDSIPNRTLGFGDSITWGAYGEPPFYPYPSILNDTMDNRVRPWDVINSGVPGELTGQGMDRIGTDVGTNLPRYVLLMEGTNDVSHRRDPAEVRSNIDIMIDIARRSSKPMRLMLGTLIPRKDDFNDETDEMNDQAIYGAANDKGVPVCDQWQAFYNYGDWESIYWDDKHPDQTGLNLLAATFYACQLDEYDDIYEDTTAPTAVLDTLPSQSPCLGSVTPSWSGTDNLDGTGVASFDVQVRVDAGAWVDWLVAYGGSSATYPGLAYGHRYYFRVRARDRIGNLSAWTAEQWTDVVDTTPPYEVHVNPLPLVSLHPFSVWWGASDACSGVATYSVQYRVDAGPAWNDWRANTTATTAVSEPTWTCGHSYYFRAQACDHAGYCSTWSSESVFTVLACFSLSGDVLTVREQPVAATTITVSPPPLLLAHRPGGFQAYLLNSGSYDITAARAGFGALPSMLDVPVFADVSGLAFYLPPLDDAVTDGGFEAGNLAAWETDGTQPPLLADTGHTGTGAVQLGAEGKYSIISQAITPPLTIADPTLSFLAQVEAPGTPSSLRVELWRGSPFTLPVTVTLPVAGNGTWGHTWLDLSDLGSSPLTVTFVVSDSAPILLDEVSLGSAAVGGYLAYLPLATK